MRNFLFVLCAALLFSCDQPKPITTYSSDKVWLAKFKDSHGGSEPAEDVSNPKGLFVFKRFDNKFQVMKADTQFDLIIDSLKNYSNSTRFFLKNKKHQLFQLSIYADSAQLKKNTVHIEFSIWDKPYYDRFMDWNPTYIYVIEATKQ